MSTDNGGPAFPIVYANDGQSKKIVPGMTLRDWFAGKALASAWQMELERPTGPFSHEMEPSFAGAAKRAYYLADAMLAERKK